MPKYIKKPVKVEAVEFEDTADSIYKITRLAGDQIIKIRFKNDSPVLHIPTKEGEMIARVGDYIIKGVEGEIYACKPRIFVKTYTPVDIAEEGRKVKKMSEMVTKSGINFTEKCIKKEKTVTNVVDVDLSGVELTSEIALETAKIKDLSVDKITAGKINDIGGAGTTIQAGTVSAQDIKKHKSSNVGKIPVIIHVDPKEVARACWEEFHNTMKRQDMRSK